MEYVKKIKRGVLSAVGKVVNSLAQNEGGRNVGETVITPGMPELIRAAAAEGTVLLKNDGILPYPEGTRVSVFGRVQLDWFCVGYGSGGDINAPYKRNLLEALRESTTLKVNEELASIYEGWCAQNPADHGFWGHWPRCHEEMPLTKEIAAKAASVSDCAVIVIGRSAGEDRENALEGGSYYLTDAERQMLRAVTDTFKSVTVAVNAGNIIDMSWLREYGDTIGAVLIPWQGGMESGNSLADVLSGISEPSGRLTDTVAAKYSDYPSAADFGNREYNNYTEDIFVGYRYFESFAKDAVLYPFGFGLGYTQTDIKFLSASLNKTENGGTAEIRVRVENTGNRAGKEVSEVYCEAPQGTLGKASRVLVAFEKTDIIPSGSNQELTLRFPLYLAASYDDSGKTSNKACYVLESGEYGI
ncbi:MAG: hypothetical protein GX851_06160 [Clostridiales bacterium]|nr:hypothetical protein [Clostridiales bacterium]